MAALKSDFAQDEQYFDHVDYTTKSHAALRELLNDPVRTPKYGNEDANADANVSWIVDRIDKVLATTTNYRDAHYRPGYWTMTIHAGFGMLTKALPNGRKARENFASGITPVSMVTPSLTKALNSVAGLPAESLSSGVALNLKFVPRDGDKAGGIEIQFNVTTHDDFIEAVKDPARFSKLLVRVSGYTAYFKDLNPRMQKEIIDRTEYLLSTGKMRSYEPFEIS